MSETKTVSQNKVYLVFLGLAAILIVMGIIFSPSLAHLVDGHITFLTHPSLIDFDGLKHAGHFGSAFFNAGMLLIIALMIYKATNTDIQGVQIAAAMMILGFSFYGKNILNIWFPITGVLIVTLARRKPLSSATALAFFSTALSPVFSVLAFGTEVLVPGSATAIAVGTVMGILAGATAAAVVDHLPSLHNGYILFNAGFAVGISGMLMNALQKAFGIGHDRFPYVEVAQAAEQGIEAHYVSGSNGILGVTLAILFGYLIVAGLALGGGNEFRKMIWHKSKGGNFVGQFGIAPSLINMGFIGLVATAYVFLVGGHLAGPLFACIWTAAGFAANGVTLRMYLPTMCGVFLTSSLTGGIAGLIGGKSFFAAALAKNGSRGMLLAAIFSCGMAPIVGVYGPLAGIFVGAVHSVLVPNTGALHGWMSLYNNGFSLSLIAIFLYPVYSKLNFSQKAEVGKSVSA